jgi:hypothetical protein
VESFLGSAFVDRVRGAFWGAHLVSSCGEFMWGCAFGDIAKSEKKPFKCRKTN